jgi:serine/threonine protein kinase
MGAGAFGRVYAAEDAGRAVALKLPATGYPGPSVRRAFAREADFHRRLSHPHVMPLLRSEVVAGLPALVFPLGRCSLVDVLDARPVGPEEVVGWAEQLLAALAHVHEQGVIHGDPKPDNLVLFEDGRLRLTDFGGARVGRRAVQGFGAGTPGYAAPEQGRGRVSPRTDVFAAGRVIECLLERTTHASPATARLWDVVARATEPQSRLRFADAGRMLESAVYHPLAA